MTGYPLRPSFDPERPHRWERYPPGALPTDAEPGDFILSYRRWHVFSALIRLGQGLRVHGDDRRRYARWSHAGLVVDGDDLIEMHEPGAIRTPLEDYRDVDIALVRIHATPADREQAVAFATWCLDQNHQIGRATFLSLALCLSTGCKFSFFVEGSMVCSGMVARCQERTGAIFNRTPSHISPADLAKYYDVDFTRTAGP